MARYLLPASRPFSPSVPVSTEVSGEDVAFDRGMSISAGDWSVVDGHDAARQSVIREATANIGALLRRPEWGMGISQTILRPLTKNLIDEMVTKIRNRMRANPRVSRFIGASVVKSDTPGAAVTITYESAGVKQPRIVTLKGAR